MNQYREASLDKQDSVEFKNFTRTPNMLIFGYQDVSPQEKWLYVCLKHMCGKKGTRHLSLRYISEQTGISTGALSKSKHSEGMIRHLHDAGLIHAEIKRPGGKGNSQYHITITDVWALNQLFFSKTRSDFGQDEDEEPEPVRNSDEPVHNSDKSVQISDEPVRNSANTNTTYKTNYKTTEQDESIASPNVDAAPAPVTDLHKWRTDSEKRRAMFADIPLSQDIEEDISMLETRKQEATDPSKQTIPAGPPADAAQRTALPQGGAVQASIPKRPRGKKVTQAKPVIVLTAQEQAFWDLWCSVWFNVDIPPVLNETAYGHVKTLAPHITTQEQMNSLEKHARKRLMEQSNISRREVQLGNCVSSYQSWKQTQQKTQRDDGPALGGYYYIGSVG